MKLKKLTQSRTKNPFHSQATQWLLGEGDRAARHQWLRRIYLKEWMRANFYDAQEAESSESYWERLGELDSSHTTAYKGKL